MTAPLSEASRRQRFLFVAEVADVMRVDPMTVYRAIRAGEFPAVKIRGRYVIPARALDAIEEIAISQGGVVDVAAWTRENGAAA